MLRKIMIALSIALAFGGTMATTAFARGGGGHGGGAGMGAVGVGSFGRRAQPPIAPQQVLRQQSTSPAAPPPSLQGPPSISAPF